MQLQNREIAHGPLRPGFCQSRCFGDNFWNFIECNLILGQHLFVLWYAFIVCTNGRCNKREVRVSFLLWPLTFQLSCIWSSLSLRPFFWKYSKYCICYNNAYPAMLFWIEDDNQNFQHSFSLLDLYSFVVCIHPSNSSCIETYPLGTCSSNTLILILFSFKNYRLELGVLLSKILDLF